MKIGELIQTADWKKEKHAPVIDCPDVVTGGEEFMVTISIGKEIPHPNTTEHHISWIDLFFHPEGEKFAYHVGRFEFMGHGESVKGANEGPVYTEPKLTVAVKVKTTGVFHAVSHCNIHGLWEGDKEIRLA
jgi:superoxide reductase